MAKLGLIVMARKHRQWVVKVEYDGNVRYLNSVQNAIRLSRTLSKDYRSVKVYDCEGIVIEWLNGEIV